MTDPSIRGQTGFREMTMEEKRIISRLFESPFPGSNDLEEQVKNCLVRSIDKNGSLDFLVREDTKANVTSQVPVEAEAEDIDGTTIHILMHVIDGIARGIEVYKEDSSPVRQFPKPSQLRLFSPP